ncbi:glutaryl-CoA dehydrogenase [Microbacteriaceae bacterium MWH-Ta3]|nr:glutaryl-CoA dehydrogenase [Microbacteriaceae bacterium MWH-Ta3]
MVYTSRTEEIMGLDALLTADEIAWRDKARTFSLERIQPQIDEDFEIQRLREELIPELGELGMLGMHINGYGCSGANAVSYGLVCYELEAVDTSWRTHVSVLGSLAMSSIAKFGSEEQKQEWLPAMARGEKAGCFGLTEPHGGSDPSNMKTTAVLDGDEWVINGAKRWIGIANIADVAIIWAQTDDAVRGFIVPTSTPGYVATPIAGKLSMRASIQCAIELTNVRIPKENMLPLAKGLGAPFKCLTEARYGIIWGVMGAARAVMDVAIERSQTREVFGKPIGAMQITQAKLADAFLEYEKGMLLSLHIGHMKDAGTLKHEQVSVGKLNNVREAIGIVSSMRSIMGGDGVTNEFPMMRHMMNLESVRTYEGTDEVHALVVGRALTGIEAFR